MAENIKFPATCYRCAMTNDRTWQKREWQERALDAIDPAYRDGDLNGPQLDTVDGREILTSDRGVFQIPSELLSDHDLGPMD